MTSDTIDRGRIDMLRMSVLIVIGAAVGFIAGLLGIGGGFVLVPVMVHLLGMNRLRAHGTSLAAVSVTAIFTTIAYGWNKQMDWPIAIELVVAGVIGALIGAKITSKTDILKSEIFSGILLGSVGILMLHKGIALFSGTDVHVLAAHMSRPGSIFAVGVLSGILSGFTGVGGGIMLIPALILLLGFPQTMAQGISLAVIIPTSIFGTLIYGMRGNIRPDVGIWLSVGGTIGGLIGVQQAVSIRHWILCGLFGILAIVLGIQTLARRPASREDNSAVRRTN